MSDSRAGGFRVLSLRSSGARGARGFLRVGFEIRGRPFHRAFDVGGHGFRGECGLSRCERRQQAPMRTDGDIARFEGEFLLKTMCRCEAHFELPTDALPKGQQAFIGAMLHDVFVQLDV